MSNPTGLGKVRKIDAAGVGAALVISALVLGLGVLPGVDAAEAARQADIERAALEAQAQQSSAKASTLRQAVAQTEAELHTARLALLPAAVLNRRLSDLAVLAEASGLSIDSVEPGTGRSAGLVHRWPLVMSGSGAYHDLADYVSALRGRLGDVAVIAVVLDRVAGSDGEPPIARFRLEMEWFSLPVERAGGAEVGGGL
ncbi:MAG: type 4a pilus biogenesis protein PilO [Planctomycetota bacterium]